jgi:hypothetical protein
MKEKQAPRLTEAPLMIVIRLEKFKLVVRLAEDPNSPPVSRLPAYQPIGPTQVADSGGSDEGNGRAAPMRPITLR